MPQTSQKLFGGMFYATTTIKLKKFKFCSAGAKFLQHSRFGFPAHFDLYKSMAPAACEFSKNLVSFDVPISYYCHSIAFDFAYLHAFSEGTLSRLRKICWYSW